ncbi:MAG: sialidase family protein [Anaerolineae bacterium]
MKMRQARETRHVIVYRDAFAYCAHPFILKRCTGEWLIVFNESMRRRDRLHPPNDPRFYNVIVRSSDEGCTWSAPRVVPGYDWYGVECSGLTELNTGEVLMNQWQFSWYPLEAAIERAKNEPIWFPPWSIFSDPAFVVEGYNDPERAAEMARKYPWARGNRAAYVHISPDGGRTWPETVKLDTSPYPGGYGIKGGLQLPNGEVLLPLTVIPGWDTVYVLRSRDGGRTWSKPAEVAHVPGRLLEEASIALTLSGRLVMQMRDGFDGYLFQCVSDDEGHTWHDLTQLPVWGYPPHLLLLPDGRLLSVYGHRREPYSIRAVISEDEGKTWNVDDILVIRDELRNDDLGYPTSVLADDGRIFTTYYCQDPDGVTCIQGTYYRV